MIHETKSSRSHPPLLQIGAWRLAYDNDETIIDFARFYLEYPRKEGRKDALKAWRQLSPDAATQQKMLGALRWQIPANGWHDQIRNRLFTPLPATWIRGERWDDQPPISWQQADDQAKAVDEQIVMAKRRQACVEQGMTHQEVTEMFDAEYEAGQVTH